MPIQGAVMPYASNIPSRGSGLAQGMSNLLNLKQAFADAVRKNAWDKERTGMEQRGAAEQLLMGQYGVAKEGTSPGGIPITSMPGMELDVGTYSPREQAKRIKKPTDAFRQILGDIRMDMQDNVPLEEIQRDILDQGYNLEEFADVLKDYNPQQPENTGWNWQQMFSNVYNSLNNGN